MTLHITQKLFKRYLKSFYEIVKTGQVIKFKFPKYPKEVFVMQPTDDPDQIAFNKLEPIPLTQGRESNSLHHAQR